MESFEREHDVKSNWRSSEFHRSSDKQKSLVDDIGDSGIVTRLIFDDLSLKNYNRINSSRSHLNQTDLTIDNL